MGASASVQTAITTIRNSISNTLIQDGGADASTNCLVKIGSIQFESTEGCTIKVSNLCGAKADVQIEAIVDATIEFYNNLNIEQKQEAPAYFTASFGVSTTVTTIVNDYNQLINQRCRSNSSINQEIEVQNIIIKNCKAPPGIIMAFEFINSGDAIAQCALKATVDLLVSASNDVAIKQSQGLDWSTIIWPVAIAFTIISVFGLLFYYKEAFVTKVKDRVAIINTMNNRIVDKIAEFKKLRNN